MPIRSRNMIQNAIFDNLPIRRFDIHGILRECLRIYHAVPNLPGMMLANCIDTTLSGGSGRSFSYRVILRRCLVVTRNSMLTIIMPFN